MGQNNNGRATKYVWKCCLRRATIGGKEIVRNYGFRDEGEITRYAYTNFTDFKPLKPYLQKTLKVKRSLCDGVQD